MKKLRVVQWTTGIVGSSSLRSIIAHPKLELVGVYCHSKDKVGVDAGELIDAPPVGVKAIDRIEDIIALKPDCVVYMSQWLNIVELEQLLASGINIVTTARIVTGKYYKDNIGQRIEAAAQKGGASFYGSGMNPMFIPTLTLAATAMCTEVTKISIYENVDCAMYPGFGTWDAYGFGHPLDHAKLKQDLWDAEPDYREMLEVMADTLDVKLDDMTLDVEYAVADADRDIGFMKIAKGTVAAIDAIWRGWVNGNVFVESRTLWKLGGVFGHTETPNWEMFYGYKLNIKADVNVKMTFSLRPNDIARDVGVSTALPVVNAIAQVCAAKPGVVTAKDLTLITGRGKVA